MLFALFEPDLSGFFALRNVLFPAGIHFHGADFELAVQLHFAAANALFKLVLFLRQAGFERECQFLFALFHLMVKILFALAERFCKFRLLAVNTMLLLADGLLNLAGGVFFDLIQSEVESDSVSLLKFRVVAESRASMASFKSFVNLEVASMAPSSASADWRRA